MLLRWSWKYAQSRPTLPILLQWTLTRRRAGASGATLLVLRAPEDGAGGNGGGGGGGGVGSSGDATGWAIASQRHFAGAEPLHSVGEPTGKPTALEAALQAAEADPQVCGTFYKLPARG